MKVEQALIKRFQQDGAVLIPGLLQQEVALLRQGVANNMLSPSPYASTNDKAGHTGLFFDDYCNWQRIPEFEQVIYQSVAAQVAAQLMQSSQVQIFHDHVLVKEPGTSMPTPWHQDSPYYFVEGEQTVSFWCALDPVKEATLQFVAGSHRWPKLVQPTRWASETNFFNDKDYMPVPDPVADNLPILAWEMQPGDAVAFHYRTLHGAPGNHSKHRRRAFSLRFVGDDARYVERPGPTSPPFPNHKMQTGQRLRSDWFPVVYTKL